MDKRRVVITGLGTVNPTGNTVAQSWAAVRNGVCGVGPITHYDTSNSKTKLAAEVKDFDPAVRVDKRESRKMARFTQFAMAAAIEAMEDAGIDMEKTDATRFATIVSAGIGGLPNMEEEHAKGEQKGFDRVSPFFVPMTIANMAAGQIAIRFGLKGMCVAPVTACAGGTNAIGDAFHRIRDGYEDLALCGGAESCISPLGVGGFTSMKALTAATDPARASLPFDAERGGFVIGEGAGILVLEELEHALARGARIYAEVVGYGTNCDAHHITAPDPTGTWPAACIQQALSDAGIAPEQVDYVNAHGTSTPLNDSGETAALKKVFGDHAGKLMVSSTKSMTGHMLGAGGAVEAIFSLLALKDGFVPATINYQVPDPACDLDIVPNQGREADIKYAISDSLGFGGHNACLVFHKWEG